MPRTRAQRRHALATALDEDTLSYILSFLPTLGVVPGRLYTLAGGSRATTGSQLSLKAILAPRRRRLIKCPDDIPLLEDAVAAAREGDVVLLTESVELQAPIIAPPFHITIAAVSRRRFGRYRRDHTPPGQFYSHGQLERALGRPSHGAYVYVNRNGFPGDGGDDIEFVEELAADLSAAVVASGADVRLELCGLAWVGEERSEELEDTSGLSLPLAINAQDGASVDVENCWFSSMSRAPLCASSGARIFARDVTIGSSTNCVVAQGDGSVIIEHSLFNGRHVYGAVAHNGGRVDVRSCRIDGCYLTGFCARGADSRIRIHKTTYMSRNVGINFTGEQCWTARFLVRNGGGVTFSATENETYHWVDTDGTVGGELVQGNGGQLDGFEDLSGGEPEPVLSLKSHVGGVALFSYVREENGYTEQSRFEFDGSRTYIPA